MGACLDSSRAAKASGVATICPSENFDMVHQSIPLGHQLFRAIAGLTGCSREEMVD